MEREKEEGLDFRWLVFFCLAWSVQFWPSWLQQDLLKMPDVTGIYRNPLPRPNPEEVTFADLEQDFLRLEADFQRNTVTVIFLRDVMMTSKTKVSKKIVSAFSQTISISTLSKWSVFNFMSMLLNVVGTKGNVHGVLHAHPGTVSSSPQPAGQTTEKTLPIRPR